MLIESAFVVISITLYLVSLMSVVFLHSQPGVLLRRSVFCLLWCALLWVEPALRADSGPQAVKVYRFGVVPQFGQRRIFHIWIPILRRLEQRTGLRFELVGSEQIPVFEARFIAGEFDFAYMNPYHVVVANNKQGYIPLVRDGARVLQGVIVVRSDSPIRSVHELSGKTVAFPSANALGASLLPRSELARRYGVKLVPRYVKTHSSVYLHVVQKLVIAGGGVRSTLQHQKPAIRRKIRILYRTAGVNPHPIVAHPRVPAKHIRAVREALIAMGKNTADRALLAKIPIQQVTETSVADYDMVRRLGLEAFRKR